jgi:hypothetical protein
MEQLGRVGVVCEEHLDLGMDGGFPVGVVRNVKEDPAGWNDCQELVPVIVGG